MQPMIATKARRGTSLADVVAFAAVDGEIDAFLREFLDAFYLEDDQSKRFAMIRDAPALTDDAKANAYLAAVAEHLALRNGLEIPGWVHVDARFLKRPFFPAKLESLKAILLVESPTAFRRRMIFVGADPLYRPRRGEPPEGRDMESRR